MDAMVRDSKIVSEAEVISVSAPRNRPFGSGQSPVANQLRVADVDIIFKLTKVHKGAGFAQTGQQVVVARPAVPNMMQAAGIGMQVGQRYVVFLIDETTQGSNQAAFRAAAAPALPGISRYEMLKVAQDGTAALRIDSGKVQVDTQALQKDYEGKDAQVVLAEIAKLAAAQVPAPAAGAPLPAPAAPVQAAPRGGAGALSAGVTVSGTVVMEGTAPRPSFQLRLAGMGTSRSVLVSEASFTVSVPDGQPQQISIADLPAGYVVRSVTDGGATNLLWTPLVARAGGAIPRIVITIGAESAGR
jgi:hypothetical protein